MRLLGATQGKLQRERESSSVLFSLTFIILDLNAEKASHTDYLT